MGRKRKGEKEEKRMEGGKAGRIRGNSVLFFNLVLDDFEQYNIDL